MTPGSDAVVRTGPTLQTLKPRLSQSMDVLGLQVSSQQCRCQTCYHCWQCAHGRLRLFDAKLAESALTYVEAYRLNTGSARDSDSATDS